MPQNRRGRETGNHDGGEHGGENNKEQIVRGVQGRDADDERAPEICDAFTRDLIVESFAHAPYGDPSRKIGDGGESDSAGEQKRGGREHHCANRIAGLARDRGKNGRRESEAESSHSDEETQPGFTVGTGERGLEEGEHAVTSLAQRQRLAVGNLAISRLAFRNLDPQWSAATAALCRGQRLAVPFRNRFLMNVWPPAGSYRA